MATQTIQGSCLSFPIRADIRGTLATISDRSEIIRQSVESILMTRQGERVMMPRYGLPDWVFDVMDIGFTARVAYFTERQILYYEPLVEEARTTIGMVRDDNGIFIPGLIEDEQIAAFQIEYRERFSNTTGNLVFPTWQLRGDLNGGELNAN